MADYADYGIHLRNPRSGENYTQCPKCEPERRHKGRTPLSVNTDKQVWNCHHCGWSGTLLTGENRRSKPNEWKEEEWRRPDPRAYKQPPNADVLKWFAFRGISAEVVANAGIVMHDSIWIPQEEGFEKCIGFPFYRNGELVNIQWRDQKKNFRFEKGAQLVFWGLEHVTSPVAREIYITEGMMDALAMREAGYTTAISVPNGAPKGSEKDPASRYRFIEDSNFKIDPNDKEGVLDKVQQIFICVDSDEPGRNLEAELVRRLNPERCLRVKWDPYCEGHDQGKGRPAKFCKDANDILQKHGKETVRAAVEGARREPVAGIVVVDTIADDLRSFHKVGVKQGIATGYTGFTYHDSITGDTKDIFTLEPGLVTVIHGIPGMGKSAFLRQLQVIYSTEHELRHGIYAPEDMPVTYAASQIAEVKTQQSFSGRDAFAMKPSDLDFAIKWMRDRFFWMLPEGRNGVSAKNYTLDDVLENQETLIRRYGVNSLTIDPWNNLEARRQKGMDKLEYLAESLQKIKRFTQVYNLYTFIVAHPTKIKPIFDPETQRISYPPPGPYDISGTADWYNMVDFILCVHYDKGDPTKPVFVYIQKRKRRHLGAIGYACLGFMESCGAYYDLPNMHAHLGEKAFAPRPAESDGSKAKRIRAKKKQPEIFDGTPSANDEWGTTEDSD